VVVTRTEHSGSPMTVALAFLAGAAAGAGGVYLAGWARRSRRPAAADDPDDDPESDERSDPGEPVGPDVVDDDNESVSP
jgi:hypothetical protein